jgi:hypothetical protein
VLSDRAVSIVANHTLADSLYVYLAFHNVHAPTEAPLDTVSRLSHIQYDHRRVADAMLTEVRKHGDHIYFASFDTEIDHFTKLGSGRTDRHRESSTQKERRVHASYS